MSAVGPESDRAAPICQAGTGVGGARDIGIMHTQFRPRDIEEGPAKANATNSKRRPRYLNIITYCIHFNNGAAIWSFGVHFGGIFGYSLSKFRVTSIIHIINYINSIGISSWLSLNFIENSPGALLCYPTNDRNLPSVIRSSYRSIMRSSNAR
jgi:hypothetical protein